MNFTENIFTLHWTWKYFSLLSPLITFLWLSFSKILSRVNFATSTSLNFCHTQLLPRRSCFLAIQLEFNTLHTFLGLSDSRSKRQPFSNPFSFEFIVSEFGKKNKWYEKSFAKVLGLSASALEEKVRFSTGIALSHHFGTDRKKRREYSAKQRRKKGKNIYCSGRPFMDILMAKLQDLISVRSVPSLCLQLAFHHLNY